MKIYTRTGDQGTTGLVGGQRILKASARISAIGEVDELNATLGLAIAEGLEADLQLVANKVQNRLFDLGSELASPNGLPDSASKVSEEDVLLLEQSMDALNESLEPLREFILPGGTKSSATLHVARCVCRRVERSLFHLSDESELRPEILRYVNRLSDWLFMAARTANARSYVSDVTWKKKDLV